jgi:hypothetical protein
VVVDKGSKEPLKIAAWWQTKVQRNLDDGGGSGLRFEGTFKNTSMVVDKGSKEPLKIAAWQRTKV